MPLLAAGGRVSDGTAAIKKLAQNLAILLPMGIAADCARPSDTLAAEKYFSDAHVVRKMIRFFRVCGRELREAFVGADDSVRPSIYHNIFHHSLNSGGTTYMNITVIGCGRWGSLITWYLDRTGHQVTLYGRPESARMQRFLTDRSNDLLTLPESVALSTDLACVKDAEVIIISIGSQSLRGLMEELRLMVLRDKTFVLCMKGLEIGTGERLSQVAREYLDSSNAIAVWLGPGHVQEFYRGVPNCMVIDSENADVKQRLVREFSSDLIRFYYGNDLLGNEVGAAAKNVVGIAAGFLDGLGLVTLKGALMSRGTREVARLIRAMGGNELSAYGLCHLGDYEATVFSPYSHNRQFGECYVQGKSYTQLAEGYYTVKALVQLGKQYGVELPICQSVYHILYENADPHEAIRLLMGRDLKGEFDS